MFDDLATAPSSSFDRVYVFFVVEHLSDPVPFLCHLGRLARPGGSIYIVVPNVDDVLLSTYSIPAFKKFYFTPAHHFYYSPPTLARLFSKGGFKDFDIVLKQRYDLSNHVHWMITGRPGGVGRYDHIFSESLRRQYAADLLASRVADTLFATIRIPEKAGA
jgi:SAM-dependent methyltransferase